MAGTPATTHCVVKDFDQPRKFLRDMRAKIATRGKRAAKRS
jgi:hypothetical protein